MTTFALVHGAWHGAWCWEPLTRELEARGHGAVAVDLPSHDPSAGCDDYARVVVDALRCVEGPVDVVGHSLGGLTIPLVAAARPVRRLVFLCAFVPRPRRGRGSSTTGDVAVRFVVRRPRAGRARAERLARPAGRVACFWRYVD